MQTADALDVIGGLTAQLKAYAAKLPPIVHLGAVPTGVKPKLEAVDEYEDIVRRFRQHSAGTPFKAFNDAVIESLEAFEAGKLLGSVQPLPRQLNGQCLGTSNGGEIVEYVPDLRIQMCLQDWE